MTDATGRRGTWAISRTVLLAALIAAALAIRAGELRAQQPHAGKASYDKWCAGCHGDTGAGDGSGAAYMLPRPRDFTKGVYQVRTTASGELPTDADIKRVIDDGMPGTAMPGWSDVLTDAERNNLVAYLKTFSAFFSGAAPKLVEVGRAPGGGDEAIAEGRRVYESLECAKCHGQAGRGDGPSAPTLTDDWDHPIRAADLTKSWTFNGGSSLEEIYTRLRAGLDGTPMPSFTDVIESGIITDEQLWRVAQYVRSLSPDGPPRVREVVRAVRVEGALAAGPGDSLWNDVESQYIPVVGQIIVKPRWFAPTADGVWVQAMHDGSRIAMRIRWRDPSRSPDPRWEEWRARIVETMADPDGAGPAAHGPDRLTVQFPATTGDAERPFFLGGAARRPVHLWRWTSEPDAVAEGAGTGLGQFTPRPDAPELTHEARFVDGEWQLQLTRALIPRDTAVSPALPVGRAIPIAFFASDGSNGEDEMRTAVSAWYALYLDVPTSPRVYATPLAAMVLTAGLGVLVGRGARAQGRHTERPTREE